MLRATRALLAIFTLGIAACTFDRSGSIPGSAPSPDARGEGDGRADSDGPVAEAEASAFVDGEDMEADASVDAPLDQEMDETSAGEASPDAAPSEADAGPPIDAADMEDAPDGGQGTDAGPARDAWTADADGGFDCSLVPNGATFLPPGETRAHCYWLASTPANWLTAANTCSSLGGHLVTLSSSAETSFVLGIVTPFSLADRVWIGATDARFSGDGPGSGPYMWIDGEPMTYTNWSSSPVQEPDGACASNGMNCEHRGAMLNNGRWVDLYEGLPYRFVCEAEL
jgi:hypothetical protein